MERTASVNMKAFSPAWGPTMSGRSGKRSPTIRTLTEDEISQVGGAIGTVAAGAIIGAFGGALGYGLSTGRNGTLAGYFAATGYGAIGGALAGAGGLTAGLAGTAIGTIGGWGATGGNLNLLVKK